MRFGYFSHSPLSAKTSSSHLVSNLFENIQHDVISIAYTQNDEGYFVSIPGIRCGLNRISRGMYGMILYSNLFSNLGNALSKILDIIKRESLDVLLYYISDLRSMLLVPYVLQVVNIPIVLMMWDPPEYQYYMSGIGKYVQNAINNRLYSSLQTASGVMLISSALRDRYPDIEITCIINHAVVSGIACDKGIPCHDRDVFKIGYAGSGYAYDNWKHLLEAIDALGWRTESGASIQIHYLGRLNKAASWLKGDGERIHIYGYLEETQQLEILSKCDLLYLPYWFGNEFSASVKYCFPAKLGVYAAAGVPVLYHGPESACVLNTLQSFNAGPFIFREKPDIQQVFREYRKYKDQWINGVRKMRIELLNLEVMQNRFRIFIKKVLNAHGNAMIEKVPTRE